MTDNPRHKTIIEAARAIAKGDESLAVTICHDAMKDEPEAMGRVVGGLALFIEAREMAAKAKSNQEPQP
jgi:acetyl-CoA acetyltransferase